MKKLIFVTGAGRGIGQAIALRLVKEEFVIAGCSRTLSQLEETKSLSGNKVRISPVDVTDENSVALWIDHEIRETGAEPWGLVSAAGVYGPIGLFTDNSWEEWKDAVEINLFGTALITRLFAKKLMTLKKPGRIVLLSGGGATQPQPRFSSYAASKAAVVRLGETLAHELKPFHITVNSIAPGAVLTKLTEDLIKAGPEKAGKDAYEKALKQREGASAPPEKAAELTAYLLSEKTASITGRLLSAIWDPWATLHETAQHLDKTDIYTLRRIVPEDREKSTAK